MVKRLRTMPPRKEKEFPKNYVESEEEKETSDDSTQDEEDDIVKEDEAVKIVKEVK